MRRKDVERLLRDKDREIARLQRANDDLLDRLALASAKPLPSSAYPEPSPNGDGDEGWISDPSQLISGGDEE